MKRGNLNPATASDFPPAKLEIGEKVHVLGWANGAVFKIKSVNGSEAVIETRRGRTYSVASCKLLALKKLEDLG